MKDNQSLLPILARNVKELREANGLTQEALADRCELSTRAIVAIENETAFARERVLVRLANELRTTPSELLRDRKGKAPELVVQIDPDAFRVVREIMALPAEILTKLAQVNSKDEGDMNALRETLDVLAKPKRAYKRKSDAS